VVSFSPAIIAPGFTIVKLKSYAPPDPGVTPDLAVIPIPHGARPEPKL